MCAELADKCFARLVPFTRHRLGASFDLRFPFFSSYGYSRSTARQTPPHTRRLSPFPPLSLPRTHGIFLNVTAGSVYWCSPPVCAHPTSSADMPAILHDETRAIAPPPNSAIRVCAHRAIAPPTARRRLFCTTGSGGNLKRACVTSFLHIFRFLSSTCFQALSLPSENYLPLPAPPAAFAAPWLLAPRYCASDRYKSLCNMDVLRSWLARLPAPTDLVILIDTRLIDRIPNLDLKFRPHASAHAPALLSTDSTTGRPTLIGGVSILSFNRAISLSSPLPSADGRLITIHLNYLPPTAAAASMLAGDFNSVVLPIDRNRPPKDFEVREGASFAKLMDNHALVDTFRQLYPTPTDVFSFHGRQRHNTATPPTSSRLDRIYISRAFVPRLAACPYIQTRTAITDHLYAPLCSLSFFNPTVAPRPWRLRQHLLMRPHVSQIVDSALAVFPSTPSPDSWDRWKLDLTLNLKRFSNQERRRVDGTIAHLEQTIGSLQRHAAYTPLTQAESNRLDQARLHLARYEAAKASEIALKAKLKVEGHREMGVSSLLSGLNSRIKGSIITSLTLPNGQTTSDLPTMTNMCSNFFQTLYSGNSPITASNSFWQHIPPSSIPNPLLLRLSAPLSLAEIGKALLSLSRGKTPGLDGLPGELFRQFSPRFAPAFHSLLSPLQPLSRLPPSMLTGRTVLIPKRGDSSLVENLRPITLMNADYKVLALCLANRLQLILPQLIHPSQTAFIKNRKIGDTINDTLDIMDWAAFSSAPLLALTVDFRKAYDLVDRPFLLQALAVLGLPASFIHWVRLMHSDTSPRISVNNMLGPTFPVRTGVRQGCPLAPLLFVCVIEIFHRYMALFLPGFALSPAQRRLMASYADDVTLFLTSDTELGLAVLLLGVFGSVSGEVTNWNKCSIIPFNIPPLSLCTPGLFPFVPPMKQNAFLESTSNDYTPCILTEPLAFNRSLLKPDNRPFGTRQHERFLLTRQLRVGHIVQVTNLGVNPISAQEFCSQLPEEFHDDATCVLPALIEAIKRPRWAALRTPHASSASPGDWFMLSKDHYSISHLAVQVVAFFPPSSVSATVHLVLPNHRITRPPASSGLFRLQDLIEVHVRDWWLAGPLHTGAGLGARIELLQDGVPSLADIRRLLYSPQPLTHHSRWTRDLTLPPPPLPGFKDSFLKDQPSRQRDILFRLYTLTLPSGSRFQYFDDRGVCPRCPAGVVETLPHIFFECSSAGNVISALRTVADRHLRQTTTAEHIFFPIQSRVGQSPPWSLLVGAAVKTLWNNRCDHKYRNSSSSSFETLQLVLAQFLIAFKIFMLRGRRQSAKKRQRISSGIKRAQKLRFLLFDKTGTPSIHPDLRLSWLLGKPFRPP
ncbi:unnamed protein product [Closterium sp. Yama58-4]|nr:unnamed protein product [Closterium sp. Yama58-4]